jgi:cytochrome c-type biogenesis protein
MGSSFAQTVLAGPMLLAIGAAVLAGLVSFLSPCILPLVPGYLSYVTGLAGADLDDALGAGSVATKTRRPRVLAGTLLFVLGFTVVLTVIVTAAMSVTSGLLAYRDQVNVVAGILIVGFGLAFLGVIPGLQREVRVHRLPDAGLLSAPLFGAVFALSWTPCIGPTLGAVYALAAATGRTDRAIVLAVAYSLGLGVPFVLFGVAFRRLIGVTAWIRRHSVWVTRIGGGLLIVVGLTLITGAWNGFLIWLQTTFDFGAGTIL